MPANTRNGSEKKLLPNTDIQIESALTLAKLRNDSVPPGTVLMQNTNDRLNTIEPLFKQGRQNIANAKAKYSSFVRQKEEARTAVLLHTSHFMQVFNLGAKRGKYSFADRVLFGMDAYSEALPKLHNESDIESAAEKVVSGEAQRIAAGKPAMANPSGAEVEAALTQFKTLTGETILANDELFAAQKEVRKLYKEARAVVKRVWREVEVHYSEGRRERMRKLAREWGVHYQRKGGEKLVKGTITDAHTQEPLAMVKVKFEKGKNKALTDAHGHFTLITNLYHKQTLLATRSGYQPAELVLELKEGEENVCAVAMVREE